MSTMIVIDMIVTAALTIGGIGILAVVYVLKTKD